MTENVLKISDLKKSFVGVKALKGVSLEIQRGEIHCLAGENGSGKSTLIKIVSGVYSIDAGSIEICGKRFEKLTPIEAILNGVQIIYQDMSLFPNLTVRENLALNHQLANGKKLVSHKRFAQIAERAAQTINLSIDMDEVVSKLSVAQKQMIAIARALVNDAKLIIMDEPTTALTQNEVARLFEVILDLKARGISILFVSHKLNELFEISDRATILRNGENVWTGQTGELDMEQFAYYMTGRRFVAEPYAFLGKPTENQMPVLEVEGLAAPDAYEDISFSLYGGEILGITGLMGSGRTELALSLFGMLPVSAGEIRMHGKPVKIRSPQEAMRLRISYVPEDRLSEGLFMNQTIAHNIVISSIDAFRKASGLINFSQLNACADEWVERFTIATPSVHQNVCTLSGGNQQRVVLAKWLARNPDVLILNGPTVGVDIGSKFDIHTKIELLAQQGMAVIIISDDLPEVMAVCSKILVMKSGRMSAVVDKQDISEQTLSAWIAMD